jgi:hypothetical protein
VRLVLVALVSLAVGVGGTLGFQYLTRDTTLSQVEVEREAARIATERDGRDVYQSNCIPRPYPEGRYNCLVDWDDGQRSSYDVQTAGRGVTVGKEQVLPQETQEEFDFG